MDQIAAGPADSRESKGEAVRGLWSVEGFQRHTPRASLHYAGCELQLRARRRPPTPGAQRLREDAELLRLRRADDLTVASRSRCEIFAVAVDWGHRRSRCPIPPPMRQLPSLSPAEGSRHRSFRRNAQPLRRGFHVRHRIPFVTVSFSSDRGPSSSASIAIYCSRFLRRDVVRGGDARSRRLCACARSHRRSTRFSRGCPRCGVR